jgi:2-iminobutanoate/2-iminopropanoate deaminase
MKEGNLMARTIINSPTLPRSKAPHSNAVEVGGLIFVSRFPGYDEYVQVPKGDFAAQMRLALKHVKAALEYAGSSVEKIAMSWPARTTIEARLPRPDFLLEIDCVAEA